MRIAIYFVAAGLVSLGLGTLMLLRQVFILKARVDAITALPAEPPLPAEVGNRADDFLDNPQTGVHRRRPHRS